MESFDAVILGLSITSSWGNGHAVTYRGLVRGLAALGKRVLFLEKDAYWYAENRDDPQPEGAVTRIYDDFDSLVKRFEHDVSQARFVMIGSFVPEGARVGDWVTSVAHGRTAFYDIDTPITLAQLETGSSDYVTPELIRRYDAYFSFTGGPLLRRIETQYGARMARALYCSVDPEKYYPCREPVAWDLGYLGTYSADRQPALDSLMLEPARLWPEGRFTVAGPMYPKEIPWPGNVDLTIHLSPHEHPRFYGAQRFTLNITREAMKRAGYSPSVRLFEAGACATTVISDWWAGLDELFAPDKEVLIAQAPEDTLRYLRDLPEEHRRAIGNAARLRILDAHTPLHRARQLETALREIDDQAAPHTPRRNGFGGQIDHRMDAGMAAQPYGKETGGTVGAEIVATGDRGDLRESAGAGHGDSGADRAGPETGSAPLERSGGVAGG